MKYHHLNLIATRLFDVAALNAELTARLEFASQIATEVSPHNSQCIVDNFAGEIKAAIGGIFALLRQSMAQLVFNYERSKNADSFPAEGLKSMEFSLMQMRMSIGTRMLAMLDEGQYETAAFHQAGVLASFITMLLDDHISRLLNIQSVDYLRDTYSKLGNFEEWKQLVEEIVPEIGSARAALFITQVRPAPEKIQTEPELTIPPKAQEPTQPHKQSRQPQSGKKR